MEEGREEYILLGLASKTPNRASFVVTFPSRVRWPTRSYGSPDCNTSQNPVFAFHTLNRPFPKKGAAGPLNSACCCCCIRCCCCLLLLFFRGSSFASIVPVRTRGGRSACRLSCCPFLMFGRRSSLRRSCAGVRPLSGLFVDSTCPSGEGSAIAEMSGEHDSNNNKANEPRRKASRAIMMMVGMGCTVCGLTKVVVCMYPQDTKMGSKEEKMVVSLLLDEDIENVKVSMIDLNNIRIWSQEKLEGTRGVMPSLNFKKGSSIVNSGTRKRKRDQSSELTSKLYRRSWK